MNDKIIIKFEELLTNKVSTREYEGIAENKAIELLKREFASSGIIILNVEIKEEWLEIEQQQRIDLYNKAIKDIDRTIKNFVKKPYTETNKIREKNMKLDKRISYKVEEYVNKKYNLKENDNIYDNKIIINVGNDYAYIIPTQDFFMSAD